MDLNPLVTIPDSASTLKGMISLGVEAIVFSLVVDYFVRPQFLSAERASCFVAWAARLGPDRFEPPHGGTSIPGKRSKRRLSSEEIRGLTVTGKVSRDEKIVLRDCSS